MQHSKIEWLRDPTTGRPGFSINPVKGLCPVDCKDNQGKSYCYARRMYKRFKWNPEIRFDVKSLLDVEKIKKPSRIFMGSTMELFGEWIFPSWQHKMCWVIPQMFPQHTFIFLTKQPENLPIEFPENCWVGVSITHQEHFQDRLYDLSKVKATVKFISFEPLLQGVNGTPLSNLKLAGISWVITGQETPYSSKTAPKVEWVKEIVEACDKAGVPVFLKDNLVGLLPREEPFYKNDGLGLHDRYSGSWSFRQEFPRCKNIQLVTVEEI